MTQHEQDPQSTEMPRRTYFRLLTLGAAAAASVVLIAYEASSHKSNPKPDKHPTAAYASAPTWHQNFVNSTANRLDTKIWHYETDYHVPGYNKEKQAYTTLNKNVRIEHGTGLIIEAHHEPYHYKNDPSARTYEYTSGRVDTRNSFNFEYGKIEADMKLPEGAGTWPAFWLLSANKPHTRTSSAPAQDKRYYRKNGEIDIMESYGHTPGVIEATAYTYADSSAGEIEIPDASTAFHRYGVEVNPTSITWTVDGRVYHSITKQSDDPDRWPFGNGNRLYVLLNLAMGGTGGGIIQDENGPWRLEVKDLSYYPYIGQ